MPPTLALLIGLSLGGSALANDDDPWGLGRSDPDQAETPDLGASELEASELEVSELEVSELEVSEPEASEPETPGFQVSSPWDMATPTDAPPPPAPSMPVMTGQAPEGLGFHSLDACQDVWKRDRSWFQRLTPTWAHPTTERCSWAAGADRWTIVERPAGMVLSAAVDGPLVASSAALALWGSTLDPVESGRENWDLGSTSPRAAAGSGAQRRDALPVRTAPDVGAGRAADWIFASSLVGAGLSPLALPSRNGRLTNTVIMGEILALQFGVWSAVSGTVGELRPLGFQAMQTWADEDFSAAASALSQPGAWRSYYSGQTSTVAAVAYGYATMFSIEAIDDEQPSAGLTLLLLPAAFMLTNLDGQLQIDALEHDATDVWVGHLAGGAIGVGVPLVHHLAALHGRDRAGVAPRGPTMVRPLIGPGSLGLTGRW